jgi:CheY-like chemotaxis protein
MGTPLTVIVADDDLLFSTRIAAAVTACGHRPQVVRTVTAFQEALREHPAAAILNLASSHLDAIAAIRDAKTDPTGQTIPLLGFCGHADAPRQAAARDAGCDLVVTNGEIATQLPRLLGVLLAASPASTPRP